MLCPQIIEIVKADFGALWQCRQRGETTELVTPFTTVEQKFVSVFIVERAGELVVSDGGWLAGQHYQDDDPDDQEEGILERALLSYSEVFGISKTEVGGKSYFFKKSPDKRLLSSCIYDVACFVSSVVNTCGVSVTEKMDLGHSRSFQSKANEFIYHNYSEPLFSTALDDVKNVRFSAILHRNSSLFLLNYVTGSTVYYFEGSIRKAIVNFDLADKSKYRSRIEAKIPLLDDTAEGYAPRRVGGLLSYLAERTSREPIVWSKRNDLLSVIPPQS